MKRKMKPVYLMITVLMAAMLLMSACQAESPSISGSAKESASAAETDALQTPGADESGSETTAEAKEITGFADVNTDKVSLIALGNSDVPVGQYSQEIFESMGVWNDIQNKISFGTNVKEVLSQVEEKSVDCGVVYATDAATAKGVKVVATAPEGTLKTPVIYPAAVLSGSKNQEAAKAFLNFLLTDEAVSAFEAVGFKMATDDKAADVKVDGSCTLNVFAATSLTESLNEIKTLFEKKYPDIKVVYNFDSSGTLKTQIEQGAEADIFFSAAQKQMKGLDEEKYIESDTIKNLLNNEVVMIVPEQ